MSESFLRFHVKISMRWEFYCDILKRCVFCDLSMEEFIFNSVDREDKKFNLHVKMEEKSSKMGMEWNVGGVDEETFKWDFWRLSMRGEKSIRNVEDCITAFESVKPYFVNAHNPIEP